MQQKKRAYCGRGRHLNDGILTVYLEYECFSSPAAQLFQNCFSPISLNPRGRSRKELRMPLPLLTDREGRFPNKSAFDAVGAVSLVTSHACSIYGGGERASLGDGRIIPS